MQPTASSPIPLSGHSNPPPPPHSLLKSLPLASRPRPSPLSILTQASAWGWPWSYPLTSSHPKISIQMPTGAKQETEKGEMEGRMGQVATWKPGPPGRQAPGSATAALQKAGPGLSDLRILPETGNRDFYMQWVGSKFNQKKKTLCGPTQPKAKVSDSCLPIGCALPRASSVPALLDCSLSACRLVPVSH